jgi:exonuclease V gamma subunit
MNESALKNLILTNTGKLKRNAIKYIQDTDILNYCNIHYKGYKSEQELLYRIKNNIYKIPLCPVCNKELKFLISKNSFQHHCSQSCATSDPKT